MKQKIKRAAAWFGDSSGNVKLSMVIMGAGQFRYGAKGKGVCFFLAEVLMICYMAMRGCRDLAGFFTLGTTRGDAWLGVEGDNSVVMLLMGIFAWIVLAAFVCIYCGNVRDTYRMQKRIEQGRSVLSFREEAAQLLDKKFYVTVLALPVIGVFIFQILPVLFMILIAFTNYGGDIVPPELVDWVGLANFKKLLTLTQFAPTFFKILGWNVVWALVSHCTQLFCRSRAGAAPE